MCYDNVVVYFLTDHVMSNKCFRSEDPQKNWMFKFSLIFSDMGLVNQRVFLTKNIGQLLHSMCITNLIYFQKQKRSTPDMLKVIFLFAKQSVIIFSCIYHSFMNYAVIEQFAILCIYK
jgi:hypothetical protein